jgi:uncharacterized phage-associated protein
MAKKNVSAPVPRRDAHDVAAAIIRMTEGNGKPISNLQLQKLLYLCQFAYAWEHGSLMFENRIEAWQYGPVVPEVYHEYSYRGASSLHKPHTHKRVWQPYPVCKFMNVPVDELDEGAMVVVKSILAKWGNATAWELVAESHKPGGPWDIVYNGTGEATGYDEVIDPMRYARWYDPETHSVKGAGDRGTTDSDGEDDEHRIEASELRLPSDAAEAGPADDRIAVTIRLSAATAKRAGQLASERGQGIAEWLEGLADAIISAM